MNYLLNSMETKETKKSGQADKPAESTAKGGEKSQVNPLSSDGIAELLKEGLNAEDKPEEEVQSGEEHEADEEHSEEVEDRESKDEGRDEQEEHKEGEEEEQEQTEETETEEAETENEEEEHEEDGDRKKLSPELQKVLDKRIGKEVGKRKALEQQLEQVKAELEQVKSTRSAASAPAAAIMDEATLDKMEENGERLVNDIEAYLDESASEKDRARVEKFMEQQGLDAAGLKAYARKVQRTLDREIPKEREKVKQYRAAETQMSAKAKVLFPFLEKKDDPNYAKAQQVLEMFPEIKRLPHWKVVQGCYVLGLQAMEKLIAAKNAEAGGKKKDVKAPVKPPKKLPVNQPPPKKETSSKADDEEASEKIRENPSAENVMDALKAGLRNL